ncbi:MAG: serine/threonine protein kinase [Planctomycetes bacterium]|nr:serine/threonine protein kinase [Planctomycetota bacterium]
MPVRHDVLVCLSAANRGLVTDLQVFEALKRHREGGGVRPVHRILTELSMLSQSQVRDLSEELDRERRALQAHPPPFLEGQSVGPYKLLELLQSVPGKAVYRAQSGLLPHAVALKVFNPATEAARESVERLKTSVREAGPIRRLGCIPYADLGCEGPFSYLATEWVDGISLAELPDRRRPGLGPPVRFFRLLAELLHGAAGAGVLHRNLSPSNVLLDLSYDPKLVDFGLARPLPELAAAAAPLPRAWAGYFVSPERAAGGDGKDVRSELFSLGSLFYECLTDAVPFPGPSAAVVLASIRCIEPMAPRQRDRSIHPGLEAICMKALEKEPGRRYASFAEMAEDLGRVQQGKQLRAKPVTRITLYTRRLRAKRRLAAGMAAGGVLVLAAYFSGDIARQVAKLVPRREVVPALSPEEARKAAWRSHGEGVRAMEEAERLPAGPARDRRARAAMDAFTRALDADPILVEAMYGRARAALLCAGPEAALADLAHCLALSPRNVAALDERAKIRLAIAARKPEDSSSRLALDQALQDLELVLEIQPDRHESRLARARARADAGRLPEALEDLDAVLDREPGMAGAYRVRGELRLRAGAAAGAASDLRRYVDLVPEESADPEVLRLLEDALQRARGEQGK